MTLTLTELAADDLPPGTVPSLPPGGAHLFALGLRDADGAVQAHALLRQRRTAEVAHVIGWHAPGNTAAALASGVESFARGRGVVLLRAVAGADAAAALALGDSGRGYLQRWLSDPVPLARPVGQYNQSTGFTCGPVSLAMAMGPEVTRRQEIALWREATTIIGLTGPGGCDPYGVLLAAHRHGLNPELYYDSDQPSLLDRANTEQKKDLMRFAQAEFRAEVEGLGLTVHRARLDLAGMVAAVRDGGMVILLIDQMLTHSHHAPHWILLHAERDGLFLVNDPWLEPDDHETIADVDCLPMRGETLWQMGEYGDPPYHAALILRPPRDGG